MLFIWGAFALIVISSAYWGVFQHNDLLTRPDNPRRILAEQGIERGLILDRNGITLAYSQPKPAQAYIQQRIYPYPDTAGALGYYSELYGEEGLEAAFDDILTGQYQQNKWDAWWDEILNRSGRGYDLQTTIDIQLQEAAGQALAQKNGAIIMLHVPTGEILAMLSHPPLDSNAITPNWPTLTHTDAGKREQSVLLNRARHGLYQPGSIIQLILLAGMLTDGNSLDTPMENIQDPITPSELPSDFINLSCLSTPPHPASLQDAFAHACPAPFIKALQAANDHYLTWLSDFGFTQAPYLYRMDTGFSTPLIPFSQQSNPEEALTLEALGQGKFTVTPLQMAQFMAAIVNDGLLPPLHMASAYRQDTHSAWQSFSIPPASQRLLSTDIATQLQNALKYSSLTSPILQALASESNLSLTGQMGSAYAGNPPILYSWFLGYMSYAEANLVIVVVVEDAQSPGEAAQIAYASLSQQSQSRSRP